MSNDNTYNPGRSNMASRMAEIMAMQDSDGLTPDEATEQASIPKPLFGGSEIIISLVLAGVVLFVGLVGIAIWQVTL